MPLLSATLHSCIRGRRKDKDHTVWGSFRHSAPVWVFIGKNSNNEQCPDTLSSIDRANTCEGKQSRSNMRGKRKRARGNNNNDDDNVMTAIPLVGRPEHTDSVSHSGTWHCQVVGSKVWYVRPLEESKEWNGRAPVIATEKTLDSHSVNKIAKSTAIRPSLKVLSDSAVIDADHGVCNNGMEHRDSTTVVGDDGISRFRIECKQGDLLVINTRLWWHRTEIPCSNEADGTSMSFARDFYCDRASSLLRKEDTNVKNLSGIKSKPPSTDVDQYGAEQFCNIDGVYASRNVLKGKVVLTEKELPDCALMRSKDANCDVSCLRVEGCGDGGGHQSSDDQDCLCLVCK